MDIALLTDSERDPHRSSLIPLFISIKVGCEIG
jgi:hypothetical protein